jgi:hypothetical protein
VQVNLPAVVSMMAVGGAAAVAATGFLAAGLVAVWVCANAASEVRTRKTLKVLRMYAPGK